MNALQITNGDSAANAIRKAGLPGAILPWRDVLHDGPVPGGLDLRQLSKVRARFIADSGWGEMSDIERDFRDRDDALERFVDHEEVALWFEHDLYDQLQLIQLLNWFYHKTPGAPRLTLICDAEYIAELPQAQLHASFARRADVSDAQLELGSRAWSAFTSDDPEGLAELASSDTAALPFLRAALARLLQEYPGVSDGLARSERQILAVIDSGSNDPVGIFRAVQALEEPKYLGDLSVWSYIERMSGAAALVETAGGGPFRAPSASVPLERFRAQRLTLTDTGRRVLEKSLDWTEVRPLDRWLGGVHLGPGCPWRWDHEGERLVKLN